MVSTRRLGALASLSVLCGSAVLGAASPATAESNPGGATLPVDSAPAAMHTSWGVNLDGWDVVVFNDTDQVLEEDFGRVQIKPGESRHYKGVKSWIFNGPADYHSPYFRIKHPTSSVYREAQPYFSLVADLFDFRFEKTCGVGDSWEEIGYKADGVKCTFEGGSAADTVHVHFSGHYG